MSGENFDISELPENVQQYIKGLRNEAANYRVERNTARTEKAEVETKYAEAGALLSQANTKLDQFATLESTNEATVTTMAELQEKFDRQTAILGFSNLTAEDATRLKGTNAEEWAADAKALSERIGTKPSGLTKDDAAGKPPPEPADDPITAAFRNAGVL